MATSKSTQYHAWQPGLDSELPAALRPLESLYHSQNSSTDYQNTLDLHQLTGIKQERLAAFTWQRLVLHELIVRVSANILVPEGDDEELLGQRFRLILDTIQQQYIQPNAQQIASDFSQLQTQIQYDVNNLLDEHLFATVKREPPISGWRAWFTNPSSEQAQSVEEKQFAAIKNLRQLGLSATDDYQATLYKSLYVVLSAIATHRGRLPNDRALLQTLITNHMSNDYGSRFIGHKLAPLMETAIVEQGYERVQNANKPVLISLKGASAAGKSTLRPLLQEDMVEHGLDSQNFAIISPDIWRRLLLDYDSLGDDFKYAGRLTGKEVNIVDGKLDSYIRAKAEHRHAIPHLLVDRFRFDSFSSKKIADVLHNTYVKYVDTMHMYFVITPPEATVDRGWLRGLDRGRYKSVEDFLGHSVEAYEGMPRLFFKWMAYDKPDFKYHFVDNQVPKGTRPRLVAYGDQKLMTVIDPLLLVNIMRYQHINIHAQIPEQVYQDPAAQSISDNCQFLLQCIATLPQVDFIVAQDASAYVQFLSGKARIIDNDCLQQQCQQPQLQQVFIALGLGS